MFKKLTSSLTGAVFFIILINLVGRGFGFLREILFANYFGMGVNFDIYLVGAVLPITINTIILYIGQNYFIPSYYKIKSNNENLPKTFFNLILIVFGFSSLLLTIILYLFAQPIIQFYLHTTNVDLIGKAIIVFKLFLIAIPLNSLISILIAYNQAEYEFRYPAISRLFINIAIIPILIIFTNKLGIYTIPIGFVTGILIQLIYLLYKTRSSIQIFTIQKSNIEDYKNLLDFSIISIILIEAIGQVYMISDRYFFDKVSEGGISSLNYAITLYMLPISVFTFAIATVVLPKFSKSIQVENIKDLKQNHIDAIRANLFIFVPITFLFYFYGDDLIKLIFERGMFTMENSDITFRVLKFYAISLVFYSTYGIYNKIIYGARLIKQLLFITILGIALKIFLNFMLVDKYQQNGLALSSSISFIYFLLASVLLISFKLPELKHVIIVKEIIFYLFNGILCYLLVEIIFNNFGTVNFYNGLIKFILFYFFFVLNLIFIKHGSIQLISNFLHNIKKVRTA